MQMHVHFRVFFVENPSSTGVTSKRTKEYILGKGRFLAKYAENHSEGMEILLGMRGYILGKNLICVTCVENRLNNIQV